jgi:hypothetical protein
MIRGGNINLHVICEKDLAGLFEFLSDLENRGDYFPFGLPSEPDFKRSLLRNEI